MSRRWLSVGVCAPIALVTAALLAPPAGGDIEVLPLGPVAPPAFVHEFVLTEAPRDERPVFESVDDLNLGTSESDISIEPSVDHRRVGAGWADWGHEYEGDVYFSDGETEVTLEFERPIDAFYVYVAPGPRFFEDIDVTIDATSTDEGRVMNTQAIRTFTGSAGWFLYTTEGDEISSITISSEATFAFGEMGFHATDTPPCPGDISGDGIINITDLSILVGFFGTTTRPWAFGDLDGDAIVSTPDLIRMLHIIGESCPANIPPNTNK